MDKIKVRVPQEDGQITGIDASGNRRWIVKDHITEVDQADLNRILSGVKGARVTTEPREKPAESKTDKA